MEGDASLCAEIVTTCLANPFFPLHFHFRQLEILHLAISLPMLAMASRLLRTIGTIALLLIITVNVESIQSVDLITSVRGCAVGDIRQTYNVEQSFTHEETNFCDCSDVCVQSIFLFPHEA